MLPAYWRGGTCGCRQRGRGRGATTTVSPTRPHDPNHQHRHHASKSSHDDPSRQAQPPNPTTQPARLRANPHTTTLEPLLQTGINERKRHHASQSSHNGSRHRQTARLKPPAPPQCEPILTYRPRASAPKPASMSGSTTVRANPHTMPLPTSPTAEPDHSTRQIASQSSHDDSQHRQTARLKPPTPPQCEPILTYCPRASAPSRHQWPGAPPCEPILTQRPAQPMAGESAGSRMCGHAPSDGPRHRLRYQTQSGTSRMPRHTRRAESHTD